MNSLFKKICNQKTLVNKHIGWGCLKRNFGKLVSASGKVEELSHFEV
jgi:hypothetical protein